MPSKQSRNAQAAVTAVTQMWERDVHHSVRSIYAYLVATATRDVKFSALAKAVKHAEAVVHQYELQVADNHTMSQCLASVAKSVTACKTEASFDTRDTRIGQAVAVTLNLLAELSDHYGISLSTLDA